MWLFEIILFAVVGYLVLLLILEGVIWKVQPDMTGGVTLHIETDGAAIKRTLYGFELDNRLYVSSNHWFRKWYHEIIKNPNIELEQEGSLEPYVAIPLTGDEHRTVAALYKMGFWLRLLCGFAPRRFLRLDPRAN